MGIAWVLESCEYFWNTRKELLKSLRVYAKCFNMSYWGLLWYNLMVLRFLEEFSGRVGFLECLPEDSWGSPGGSKHILVELYFKCASGADWDATFHIAFMFALSNQTWQVSFSRRPGFGATQFFFKRNVTPIPFKASYLNGNHYSMLSFLLGELCFHCRVGSTIQSETYSRWHNSADSCWHEIS